MKELKELLKSLPFKDLEEIEKITQEMQADILANTWMDYEDKSINDIMK